MEQGLGVCRQIAQCRVQQSEERDEGDGAGETQRRGQLRFVLSVPVDGASVAHKNQERYEMSDDRCQVDGVVGEMRRDGGQLDDVDDHDGDHLDNCSAFDRGRSARVSPHKGPVKCDSLSCQLYPDGNREVGTLPLSSGRM